jgi:Flp pilus assembly protein TadD
MLLAVTPHETSKLPDENDLYAISTMALSRRGPVEYRSVGISKSTQSCGKDSGLPEGGRRKIRRSTSIAALRERPSKCKISLSTPRTTKIPQIPRTTKALSGAVLPGPAYPQSRSTLHAAGTLQLRRGRLAYAVTRHLRTEMRWLIRSSPKRKKSPSALRQRPTTP